MIWVEWIAPGSQTAAAETAGMKMPTPLWTLRELVDATDGRLSGGKPTDAITGVTIDTRQAQAGDLFVALAGDPGPRFFASSVSDRDGHDFLDAAAEAGASAALVAKPGSHPIPSIQVADTLDGLWAIGRAARSRLAPGANVVAVTGSSGKTTAKTFLAEALGAYASGGSLNNHLGVPLTLARMPRETTTAIVEIGTNHPGEIAPLSQLTRPNVAVVLNVQSAHIEYFEDQAALRAEKLSIADGLTPEGTLVLFEDLTPPATWHGKTLRFGTDPNCNVVLTKCEGTNARFKVAGRDVDAQVPGGGHHRALTLGAALCVCLALEAPLSGACRLPDSLVPAGRGNIHSVAGIQIIDDSYNANPASMAASLESLVSMQARRRFALLGEMLELGTTADDAHRKIADQARALDGCWLVGSGFAGCDPHYHQEPDAALLDDIVAALAPGDVLLVKGSNRVFWQQDFVSRLKARLAG